MKLILIFQKHKGEIKFRIVRDFFKESILNFPSILVFDSIYLLKKNFINFENYKLTTVAKSVLGDDKIDIFEESTSDENENKKIFEIEKLYLNNPKN